MEGCEGDCEARSVLSPRLQHIIATYNDHLREQDRILEEIARETESKLKDGLKWDSSTSALGFLPVPRRICLSCSMPREEGDAAGSNCKKCRRASRRHELRSGVPCVAETGCSGTVIARNMCRRHCTLYPSESSLKRKRFESTQDWRQLQPSREQPRKKKARWEPAAVGSTFG
jgi:hypothetical protein